MPRRNTTAALALLPALWFPLVLAGCASMSDDRLREVTADGIYLFRQGDYTEAQEDFEYALKLKPHDPGLLYNLGQCYDHLGANAKAEQLYQECLLESPNHAPCRHALALLLFRQGKRADADRMIEDWLSQEPQLADAYAEDGWRLRQDGDLVKAQARLHQARNLDPHNVRALTEMGILFELMDRPERAVHLYEMAVEYDPQQDELRQRIAMLKSKGVGKPLPD